MSTNNEAAERVQITPELLAGVEQKARAASPGWWRCWNGWRGAEGGMRALRVGPGGGGGITAHGHADVVGSRGDLEHVATANPAVVLALVERIRRLEAAALAAIAEHE